MKEYLVCLVLFTLLMTALPAPPPQKEGASVNVKIGPNVRLDEEGRRQAEPYIPAHPEDPKSLIISASEIVEGKGIIAQAYSTTDGGKPGQLHHYPECDKPC